MNEKEIVISQILSCVNCLYSKEELEAMDEKQLARVKNSLFLSLRSKLNVQQFRVICIYETMQAIENGQLL